MCGVRSWSFLAAITADKWFVVQSFHQVTVPGSPQSTPTCPTNVLTPSRFFKPGAPATDSYTRWLTSVVIPGPSTDDTYFLTMPPHFSRSSSNSPFSQTLLPFWASVTPSPHSTEAYYYSRKPSVSKIHFPHLPPELEWKLWEQAQMTLRTFHKL